MASLRLLLVRASFGGPLEKRFTLCPDQARAWMSSRAPRRQRSRPFRVRATLVRPRAARSAETERFRPERACKAGASRLPPRPPPYLHSAQTTRNPYLQVF
jgi:hypothetical protein